MGILLIQEGGLKKKEENGIRDIYSREWAVPDIPIWGSFLSFSCQWSPPIANILNQTATSLEQTFILMTGGYLWDLKINSKAPPTASGLFALVGTVTFPANTEIFALDLSFLVLCNSGSPSISKAHWILFHCWLVLLTTLPTLTPSSRARF